MFIKQTSEGYDAPLPAIHKKTLAYGDRTLMTEFLLDGDSTLPSHAHPYEQTGYLVRGHMILTIGDQSHDVTPGDSWSIPAGVVHGARIIEDSVAIEVFSPPREDYIPAR